MADNPSAEPPGEPVDAVRALLSLGHYERLAALGALICLGSLVLPWYHLQFASRFRKSGFGAFGFAEAALIITVGAALVLLIQVGRGRRPPLPLHEGTLLATAGVWSAVIIGFLMLDRPSKTIISFPTHYGLSYGLFVALGGAATLTIAGLRIRHAELGREGEAGLTSEAGAARSPTSASRTRSPR